MNFCMYISDDRTAGGGRTQRVTPESAGKVAVRHLSGGCVAVYKLISVRIYDGRPRDRYDIVIQTIDADRSVDEARAEDVSGDRGEAYGLFRTLVKHKVTPCTLADIIHDRRVEMDEYEENWG